MYRMVAVRNRARRQRIHQNRNERRRSAGLAGEQTSTRPARDEFAGNFCCGRRAFGVGETVRRRSRRRRHGHRRCPNQVSFSILNRIPTSTNPGNQGIRSETLYMFHSQVLPLSEENAWPHTGRSLFRASHRNSTILGFPLNISLQKKYANICTHKAITRGYITSQLLSAT